MRDFFGDLAHSSVVKEYHEAVEFDKVLIGGGWKPGHSTDYDSIKSAELYAGKLVINVSSADYLYDKNPKEFPDAQKIMKASWDELQAIVGEKWTPGAHTPFDPEATKLGGTLGITLTMVGKDLDNMKRVLNEEEFNGTLIN